MATLLKILFLLTALAVSQTNDLGSGVSEGCVTPQYLPLGEMGIVKCVFQDFYSVFWYNSTDSETETPLVALKGTTKSGDGYLSGKFDVLLNGSFVIETVSEQNDHFYRAIVVHTKEGDDYETYDIRVYVTVGSQQPHPYIDICGKEPFCFVQLNNDYKLDCSVTGTRPAADLAWVLRNASGDHNVSSDVTDSFHNTLYTTKSKTLTHFEGASLTVLLVCKVFGPPKIISVSESMVLVENMTKEYPYSEEQITHVKIGDPLKMSPSSSVSYAIWKKKSADGSWVSVLNVYVGGQVYSKVYLNEYRFGNDGSLLVSHAGIETEGTYLCIYNDGVKDTIEMFKVIVFVPPASPAAIVQGCQRDKRCVLKVQHEGNLTCSVKGIRPKVELQWLPFPAKDSKYISFFDREVDATKTGDTYDISVTTRYKLRDETQTTLAVECRVSDWDIAISDLDKKIELQFISGNTDDTQSGSSSVWIIVVVLVLIIVMVAGSAIYILKKRKERQRVNTPPAQSTEKETFLPDPEQPSTVNKKVDEQTPNETQNLLLEKSPAQKTCEDGSSKLDDTDASVIAEVTQTWPSQTEEENKGMEKLEMESQQVEDPKPPTEGKVKSIATEGPEIKTRDKTTVQPHLAEERGKTTLTIPIPVEGGENGEYNHTNGTEKNHANEALPEMVLTSEEKRNMLEEELLFTYQSMYKLPPVPGTSDERCCVNEFFTQLPLKVLKRSGSKSTANEFVQEVPSHHDIFQKPKIKPSRCVLTGNQGYGKKTLALQMAYEWCEKREQTYMKNYKIFVLLNLAALKSFHSLKQAIKVALLSKSPLTEEDIQEAIDNYSNGLIVMLGYHQFHDDKEKEDSEFAKIVAGKSLSNFDVMLITTPSQIPHGLDFDVPVIELTGFEEETQMKYIQKHLSDRMPSVADDVRETFKKNPALHEICHNPMFFTFYLKIYKQLKAGAKNPEQRKTVLQSVTEFVKEVLDSLEAPARNLYEKEKYNKIKEKLETKAFDGLSTSSSKEICWDIDKITSDPVEINFCKESGFLVFDSVRRTSQKPSQGMIAFRHKIFLEWYAARSQLAAKSIHKNKQGTWENIFSNSSPFLKYFLIGLHESSSNLTSLITYLGKNEREVSPICFLELQATVSEKKKITKKIIENFFKNGVLFEKYDSKLYQSSASLCLDAISKNTEVTVVIDIRDCLICDDCSEDHLNLESGVKIPNLLPLTKLDITLTGQFLKGAKVVPILKYASKCRSRLHLKFHSCFLSESYKDEPFLEKLSDAKVKVEWAPNTRGTAALILNNETGRWEENFGKTQITTETYQDMEQKFKAKIQK